MAKTPSTPQLKKLPFGKGVAPDELFTYCQFEELKQLLILAIEQRSMILITGEAGVGKTTAVHAVVSELPANKYSPVYLGQDRDGTNVIRRLAAGLGLQPRRFRAHAWMQVGQQLSDNYTEQGKTPVVVVDEAHLLDDSTLEDLRLLTNTDFDRASPLVLILLGQLPLRARLKSPAFEALSQRLRFRYALEGFTEEETASYIKHCLRLVDAPEDLFTAEAIKQIFLASRGILREINNYATQAVLKAQAASLTEIDAKVIRQVLDQRELS
jgi:type II secretory pathway predicted ATPase ExeA